MLYATREDIPGHVPLSRIVEHDIFTVDAPDGDFAAAMVRLRDSGVPDLFWTPRNGGHWVAMRDPLIRTILEDTDRFSSRAMRVPKEANPVPPMIPLMLDPPEHHKYRRLIAPAMTPGAVRRLEDPVRALTIQLIEELEPKAADADRGLPRHARPSGAGPAADPGDRASDHAPRPSGDPDAGLCGSGRVLDGPDPGAPRCAWRGPDQQVGRGQDRR
jgi:hypothetical protein